MSHRHPREPPMPPPLCLRCLFSVLTISAVAITPAPARAAATVTDWRADIDAIVADIRLLHPDPFTITGRTVFMREAEALKAAMPELTDEQRVVRAMRLVAMLGDGHSYLEPTGAEFKRWYPIRLYEFSDGIFVTCAHRSVADLAGAQVLEIAGRPAREVVDAARDLMGADNAFGRLDRLSAVHSAGLMQGLGYADATGALTVRVKRSDGKVEMRTLRPTPADRPGPMFEWRFRSEVFGLPFGSDSAWVSAYRRLPSYAFLTSDTTRPAHLIDRRPYAMRAYPAQNAFYIRTNQVTDYDFVQLFREALSRIDQQRTRRVIV